MRKMTLSLVLLAGCAAPIEPKPISGPSGQAGYSMQCSGMMRTLEACYQKAGEVCPKGYNVVAQNSSVVGLPVAGGTMIAPQHSLIIECK